MLRLGNILKVELKEFDTFDELCQGKKLEWY